MMPVQCVPSSLIKQDRTSGFAPSLLELVLFALKESHLALPFDKVTD